MRDRLMRLRLRNATRLSRREILLQDARGCYIRQRVRRQSIEDRYDRAIQLVMEARSLEDYLRFQLIRMGGSNGE